MVAADPVMFQPKFPDCDPSITLFSPGPVPECVATPLGLERVGVLRGKLVDRDGYVRKPGTIASVNDQIIDV